MDLLETVFVMFVLIAREWSMFEAMLVFPLLLLAYRLWSLVRAGERVTLAAFAPNSGLIWSTTNNVALALTNSFIWMAMLVWFYEGIDGFWTETVGIDRFAVIDGWPFWLQLVFALIILDFKNYWSHRLLHRPWAWEFHSLHHSDRDMNHTTAARIHILESLQMSLVSLVVLGWLDMPLIIVGVAGLLRTWYSFYIHSGLPFDHGRLRKVFASPNYHRWHHADDPAVYGKNLCDMFPLWDILFRTYHDPGWCDRPTGVSDAPDDAVRGQLHPFIRYGQWISGWAVRRFGRRDQDVKAPPAANADQSASSVL
ncbi:sterol desaturase family protein [Algimonas porphyrae]|uniref:Fatty acid hydroxylase domain-containing protein n=1 Tax=Algimonas porphyrae TaxID=1128113 RepID=A0ABQ5V225_9PROT|nr:sterol desaturase family protein [Algimonas porphyrae]GLQ20646.1 hypothetical protein GCM10007854_16010 [Algimonas porphyrae]